MHFLECVYISIKISLNFVPNGPIDNIPALVQIMAWRRPGDKPLSEPMVVNLLTHICVARPQWVNDEIQHRDYNITYWYRYDMCLLPCTKNGDMVCCWAYIWSEVMPLYIQHNDDKCPIKFWSGSQWMCPIQPGATKMPFNVIWSCIQYCCVWGTT